jgi:hypothetical protein
MGAKIPPILLVKMFSRGILGMFFDIIWVKGVTGIEIDKAFISFIVVILSLVVTIVLGYSFYFLFKKTPRNARIFIFALMGTILLPIMFMDLVFGGQRLVYPRYLIPFYLCLQLAVASFFASTISPSFASVWSRRLCRLCLVVLVIAGILSCAVISQAEFWWNKYYDTSHPSIARLVNKVSRPLLISNTPVESVLSLSYLLDSKVNMQLVGETGKPEVASGYKNIFLFKPTKSLTNWFKKNRNYKIQRIGEGDVLWVVQRL